MPALALLMLHLFGMLSFLTGDGGSGAGDPPGGDNQGDPPADESDEDDDDTDGDKPDPTKLREALRKERGQRRTLARQVKELLGFKQTIEQEQRAASEKQAKDQGNYQQLADERATEVERLKGELAARDRGALRQKVASKYNLSSTLAARLIGDTEADLERDAKELAKEVAPPKAPDTETGKRNQGGDPPKSGGVAVPYRFQQPNDVKW